MKSKTVLILLMAVVGVPFSAQAGEWLHGYKVSAYQKAGEMGKAGLGFVNSAAGLVSAQAAKLLACGQNLVAGVQTHSAQVATQARSVAKQGADLAAPYVTQAHEAVTSCAGKGLTLVQDNPYTSAGIAAAVVAAGYCAYPLYKEVRQHGVMSVVLDQWDYAKNLSYGRLAVGSLGIAGGVAACYAALRAKA